MVLKHHKDRLVGRDVPSSYQFRGIKKDGTIRRIELDVVLVEKDDQFPGTRLYLKDVTDRYENEEKIRAALKEKEVLLREIHHRVKNNMQIISSLLNLQSHSIKDEDALQIFKISQNRIRSMALIHETLYRSDNLAGIDFSDYVKRITSHLLRLYKDDASEITVSSDVKDVFLDINRAIPCGLILNELISNSLKHAFPGKKKGEIKIYMHSGLKGKYTLIVSDTGIGYPEELDIFKTKTLGMKLVSDLVNQLDGALSLIREKGTSFRIEF